MTWTVSPLTARGFGGDAGPAETDSRRSVESGEGCGEITRSSHHDDACASCHEVSRKGTNRVNDFFTFHLYPGSRHGPVPDDIFSTYRARRPHQEQGGISWERPARKHFSWIEPKWGPR